MTYERVKTGDDLPPAGLQNERARERVDIDFKRYGDDMKSAETAKDIASFKNQLGGVLVFGADCETDKGRIESVAPLPARD